MDHNDDVSATKESKPGATGQPVILDLRHACSTPHTAASWELQIPWIALQRVFSVFTSPIKNVSEDYSMLLSSQENIFVFFERIFNTFFPQSIQSQLKEIGLAQENVLECSRVLSYGLLYVLLVIHLSSTPVLESHLAILKLA